MYQILKKIQSIKNSDVTISSNFYYYTKKFSLFNTISRQTRPDPWYSSPAHKKKIFKSNPIYKITYSSTSHVRRTTRTS